MATIPPHTHVFTIPNASVDEIANGTGAGKAVEAPELRTAINADLALRAAKDQNLSDLQDAAEARVNLGFPDTTNRFVRNGASGEPVALTAAQTANLDAVAGLSTSGRYLRTITAGLPAVLGASESANLDAQAHIGPVARYKSRADAISNYHPVTAVDMIEVDGYAAYGDGPRLRYARNGTTSGDLVITRADSVLVGYDQVLEPYVFDTAAAAGAAKLGKAAAIQTAFLDTNQTVGSGSSYRDAGTVNPNAPGQISVQSQGVTHFYTRSNAVIRPQQHGCKSGGNAATNRAAIVAALQEADWHGGREIDMGTANDLYDIDSGISHTGAAKPVLRGTGATIKLASSGANSQDYGLRLVTPNLGFDVEGVTVDGNLKTPNPVWLENTATSFVEANVRDGRLVGVGALGAYRRLNTDNGGRAIRVAGYYRHVTIQDFTIGPSAMADGAGIAGTVGIIGLFAGLRGGSSDDAPLQVDIINGYIDRTSCENTAYGRDQDAISLLFPWPVNAADRKRHTVNIRGGRIIDACVRGVKAQVGNIDISGTVFEARNIPTLTLPLHNLIIDLQHGSGTVRGVRAIAHNGQGWNYGVLSNPPITINGHLIVDDMIISGIGTPRTMTAMVYKASTAVGTTSPGSATLANSGTENFFLTHAMHYQDKSNGQGLGRVVNCSFRDIATSGILLEGGTGSDVVTGMFRGNSHFGSFVPRSTSSNCTPTLQGTTGENYLFS